MARQLGTEEKRNIILLYLGGHTQHAIAKKTRRSIGIVNAVISDWETGKGIEPESGSPFGGDKGNCKVHEGEESFHIRSG